MVEPSRPDPPSPSPPAEAIVSGEPEPTFRERAVRILLVAGVVWCATGLATPPLALLAGLVISLSLGNPYLPTTSRFSKGLLKLSIIALGFGIPIVVVLDAGADGFLSISLAVGGVVALGLAAGLLLGVPWATSALVTIGTAICGGSAIAALGPAIRARADAMAVALGTVFVLNAAALYVFPPLGHWAGLTQHQFGAWAAIAIHDTASVVGAASVYGEEALEVATVLKLVRTLWIIPLVLLGAAWATRRLHEPGTTRPRVLSMVPWFIVGFAAAAGIRGLLPGQADFFDLLRDAGRRGLVVTLFLIGAGLTRETVRRVGLLPFVQAIFLWAAVSLVGLLFVLTL